MSYANTDQVAAELGRPSRSAAETAQWQAWLEKVERKIVKLFRGEGLDLAGEIAAGRITAGDVADVEVERVVDRIRNPDPRETSVSRTVDDATVTRRREGPLVDALELTTADIEALLPERPTGSFSTRPGFEPDRGLNPLHCR